MTTANTNERNEQEQTMQNMYEDFKKHFSKSQFEELEESIKKLDAFDEKHFVVCEGGKLRVYIKSQDEDGRLRLPYLSYRDFPSLYDGQTIAMPSSPGNKSKLEHVSLAWCWLKNSERTTYEGIIFDPTYTGNKFYNLWEGFCIKGKEGGFPHIEHHLREVWCDGNQEYYDYIIKWFAHLVQHPGHKPGVALVIKGKKGTGKSGIVERLFTKILGNAYAKLDSAEQVIGKFNGHHFGKLLLTLEEAIWAGDKPNEGKLKSLITEQYSMIESKGVDAVAKKNFYRFIFITNEKFAVPATRDERRFFALKVSDRHQGDKEYFKKLYSAMEQGEVEHFFHYLKTFEFNKIDVLTPPKSIALFEDILENMDIFDRWLYDSINDALSCVDEYRIRFDSYVSTGQLFDHFCEYVENTKKLGHFVKSAKVRKTTKLTQELKNTYGFLYTIHHKERNSIYFPAKDECKRLFEQAYPACKVTWDVPLNEPLGFDEDATTGLLKKPYKKDMLQAMGTLGMEDKPEEELLAELRELGQTG